MKRWAICAMAMLGLFLSMATAHAACVDNVVLVHGNTGKPADFDKVTDEDWDEVMGVNLKGSFICAQEALPYLARAGGGSIVRVDEAGQLHVGPRSAGAVPGPACYAQGGKDATLTDANVVLGYLHPERLPSGLALGAILGIVGFFRILLWQRLGWYDYGEHHVLVALTVGCSLVGVVTFGSLAGSMLPFLLRRLGFDPASASAPFVATLVDVTGLIIYFTVAFLMLRGTLL